MALSSLVGASMSDRQAALELEQQRRRRQQEMIGGVMGGINAISSGINEGYQTYLAEEEKKRQRDITNAGNSALSKAYGLLNPVGDKNESVAIPSVKETSIVFDEPEKVFIKKDAAPPPSLPPIDAVQLTKPNAIIDEGVIASAKAIADARRAEQQAMIEAREREAKEAEAAKKAAEQKAIEDRRQKQIDDVRDLFPKDVSAQNVTPPVATETKTTDTSKLPSTVAANAINQATQLAKAIDADTDNVLSQIKVKVPLSSPEGKVQAQAALGNNLRKAAQDLADKNNFSKHGVGVEVAESMILEQLLRLQEIQSKQAATDAEIALRRANAARTKDDSASMQDRAFDNARSVIAPFARSLAPRFMALQNSGKPSDEIQKEAESLVESAIQADPNAQKLFASMPRNAIVGAAIKELTQQYKDELESYKNVQAMADASYDNTFRTRVAYNADAIRKAQLEMQSKKAVLDAALKKRATDARVSEKAISDAFRREMALSGSAAAKSALALKAMQTADAAQRTQLQQEADNRRDEANRRHDKAVSLLGSDAQTAYAMAGRLGIELDPELLALMSPNLSLREYQETLRASAPNLILHGNIVPLPPSIQRLDEKRLQAIAEKYDSLVQEPTPTPNPVTSPTPTATPNPNPVAPIQQAMQQGMDAAKQNADAKKQKEQRRKKEKEAEAKRKAEERRKKEAEEKRKQEAAQQNTDDMPEGRNDKPIVPTTKPQVSSTKIPTPKTDAVTAKKPTETAATVAKPTDTTKPADGQTAKDRIAIQQRNVFASYLKKLTPDQRKKYDTLRSTTEKAKYLDSLFPSTFGAELVAASK